MKKELFALFTCWITTISFPFQSFSRNQYPDRPDTLSVVSELINKQYPNTTIVNILRGDLNDDGTEDLVVITEYSTQETVDHLVNRVYILIGTGDSYQIATFNDNLVTRNGSPRSDTYTVVSIEKKRILFEETVGDCSKTLFRRVFQYNKKRNDWFLVDYSKTDYNCNDENISLQRKKISFGKKYSVDFRNASGDY